MGHSVESLRLVFQSLLSTQSWLHDADVLPIPYKGGDGEAVKGRL